VVPAMEQDAFENPDTFKQISGFQDINKQGIEKFKLISDVLTQKEKEKMKENI
jgi:hypothetical protein